MISIIVPVYNVEKFIHRCINSILAQTYADFELILVDDGSIDNSALICDDYVKKDERVKVIHKDNGGVSSARNAGIKISIGTWICFLDADDELYPNSLEILTKGIGENVAYIMAGYTTHNENYEEIYRVETRRSQIITPQAAITQMFIPQDYIYHGYLWNKLYRTSYIFDHELLFNERIHFNEDRLFNVLYLLKVKDSLCYYTTEPVYKYTEREGGAMGSLKKRYNPKFSTDLTAYLIMLEALQSANDKVNCRLCKKQAYDSYSTNLFMMKKFGSYTKGYKKKLYDELRQHLSLLDVLYIRSKNILRRIKYRVFKFIYHEV